MDLIKFGQVLSELLPKIKTKLQLSGLALGLAFALFVHFAKPGDTFALLTAGSVGISLVIFGQLFHFLKDFAEHDRPRVFLLSFTAFCVFTLSLLVVTLLLVRKPSMSITKYDPPPDVEAASHAPGPEPQASKPTTLTSAENIRPVTKPAAAPPKVAHAEPLADASSGEELVLPERDVPRNADYTFSIVDDVPTLKARLMYLVNSRKALFPDADFHEAVSWGSPWLSFDIANPSSENLFFTSLKTEAVEIRLLNDVILHVPDIESATMEHAELKIVNEGWGKAKHPTLDLRFARPIGGDKYVVVGQKMFDLDSFDAGTDIELGPYLPPPSKWQHRSGFTASDSCKVDGYLAALGCLRYTDDEGIERLETFRTGVHRCIGGGGNILPSAYYNVTLPYEKDEYPVVTVVSNCIAPKSADKLVIRLTAKRSSHFRLKFTLTSTSGITLERLADVEILVPRFEHQLYSRDGEFFEGRSKTGCT